MSTPVEDKLRAHKRGPAAGPRSPITDQQAHRPPLSVDFLNRAIADIKDPVVRAQIAALQREAVKSGGQYSATERVLIDGLIQAASQGKPIDMSQAAALLATVNTLEHGPGGLKPAQQAALQKIAAMVASGRYSDATLQRALAQLELLSSGKEGLSAKEAEKFQEFLKGLPSITPPGGEDQAARIAALRDAATAQGQKFSEEQLRAFAAMLPAGASKNRVYISAFVAWVGRTGNAKQALKYAGELAKASSRSDLKPELTSYQAAYFAQHLSTADLDDPGFLRALTHFSRAGLPPEDAIKAAQTWRVIHKSNQAQGNKLDEASEWALTAKTPYSYTRKPALIDTMVLRMLSSNDAADAHTFAELVTLLKLEPAAVAFLANEVTPEQLRDGRFVQAMSARCKAVLAKAGGKFNVDDARAMIKFADWVSHRPELSSADIIILAKELTPAELKDSSFMATLARLISEGMAAEPALKAARDEAAERKRDPDSMAKAIQVEFKQRGVTLTDAEARALAPYFTAATFKDELYMRAFVARYENGPAKHDAVDAWNFATRLSNRHLSASEITYLAAELSAAEVTDADFIPDLLKQVNGSRGWETPLTVAEVVASLREYRSNAPLREAISAAAAKAGVTLDKAEVEKLAAYLKSQGVKPSELTLISIFVTRYGKSRDAVEAMGFVKHSAHLEMSEQAALQLAGSLSIKEAGDYGFMKMLSDKLKESKDGALLRTTDQALIETRAEYKYAGPGPGYNFTPDGRLTWVRTPDTSSKFDKKLFPPLKPAKVSDLAAAGTEIVLGGNGPQFTGTFKFEENPPGSGNFNLLQKVPGSDKWVIVKKGLKGNDTVKYGRTYEWEMGVGGTFNYNGKPSGSGGAYTKLKIFDTIQIVSAHKNSKGWQDQLRIRWRAGERHPTARGVGEGSAVITGGTWVIRLH